MMCPTKPTSCFKKETKFISSTKATLARTKTNIKST